MMRWRWNGGMMLIVVLFAERSRGKLMIEFIVIARAPARAVFILLDTLVPTVMDLTVLKWSIFEIFANQP